MDHASLPRLLADLLVILAAGLAAGVACKRLGVSLLAGYLLAGAAIGGSALGLVGQERHELELIAEAGALLLLFSVGIEFSLGELSDLRRFLFVAGPLQMVATAAPLVFVCRAFGFSTSGAVLAALAAAVSSTVVVFKALTEWGQTNSGAGRRAIGVLLFQDVALAPLMLLIPFLAEGGAAPSLEDYLLLAAKSSAFVAGVLLLREATIRWGAPLLAELRSVELVVLSALTVLLGAGFAAYAMGLPAALGALAAGMALGGNRLSKQIDSILLPFRESFAAVFFVSLGTLLDASVFLREPLLLSVGLAAMIALKTIAAAVALRCVGATWRSALGVGLALAQLGEFSFLLVAAGMQQGVISAENYNRMLFVALGTLVLCPWLIRWGFRIAGDAGESEERPGAAPTFGGAPIQSALVVGLGPIGRQIASRLEMLGVDVRLVDLSPINLQPFAQQGFHTIAGDARDAEVLRRATIGDCRLAVLCVPNDEAALQTVKSIRRMNPHTAVLVRCRYLANVAALSTAGATTVVSEEREASGVLLRQCEEVVRAAQTE